MNGYERSDIYIVVEDDSSDSFEREYGLSVSELLELNDYLDEDELFIPGQILNVPQQRITKQTADLHGMQNSVSPWYEFAKKEMFRGIIEFGSSGNNGRIVMYHQTTTYKATNDETPWCSSFVNWCVEQAGIRGTENAAARSWAQWGQELNDPRVGCLSVFKIPRPSNPAGGHVGFYFGESPDSDFVMILGGNQCDKINISPFPRSKLLSYRWPR